MRSLKWPIITGGMALAYVTAVLYAGIASAVPPLPTWVNATILTVVDIAFLVAVVLYVDTRNRETLLRLDKTTAEHFTVLRAAVDEIKRDLSTVCYLTRDVDTEIHRVDDEIHQAVAGVDNRTMVTLNRMDRQTGMLAELVRLGERVTMKLDLLDMRQGAIEARLAAVEASIAEARMLSASLTRYTDGFVDGEVRGLSERLKREIEGGE